MLEQVSLPPLLMALEGHSPRGMLKGVFGALFGHATDVATIERGRVPVLNAPHQVLVVVDGD